jgi:hypothetical protein
MNFKRCLRSSYKFASSAGDSLSATSIAIVHVDAFTNLTLKAKQLRECLGDCGVTMLGALMNHFLSITMDIAEKVCCVDWQPTLSNVTHEIMHTNQMDLQLQESKIKIQDGKYKLLCGLLGKCKFRYQQTMPPVCSCALECIWNLIRSIMRLQIQSLVKSA